MKLLLLLLTLVAAGCGGAAEQPATQPTTTAGGTDGYRSHGPTVAQVAGRTFVSTSVRGDHELVAGSRITLSFTPEKLTASAGCATLSGPYSLFGDGLRMTGEIERTTADCEPALRQQDDWLAGFLTAQSSTQLVGDTLSLGGRAVYITLDER